MENEDKPGFLDFLNIPGMAWVMSGYWAICLVAGLAIYFEG